MRFDLDEARAANSNKGSQGRASGSGSIIGTMSRNLGDEINRRLMEVDTTEEEQKREDDGDDIVETIVTTQRRRVGQVPVSRTMLTVQKVGRTISGSQGGESSNIPIIRVEEEIEFADAGTLTDPVDIRPINEGPGPSTSTPLEHPPAYTAKPEPVNEQEVLDKAHPHITTPSTIGDEDYDCLVEELGVRCTVLEHSLQERNAEQRKFGTGKPLTPSGRKCSELIS